MYYGEEDNDESDANSDDSDKKKTTTATGTGALEINVEISEKKKSKNDIIDTLDKIKDVNSGKAVPQKADNDMESSDLNFSEENPVHDEHEY